MATTASSTCSGFFSLRSSDAGSSVRVSSSKVSPAGCGKLDGVAAWFINGVATAFFASLEHCSCIRIATEEEDVEEANDLPLMLNDGNLRHNSGTTSRRRTATGKKNGGAIVEDE